MKTKYLLTIALSSCLLSSCEGFFDLAPKDRLTSESFWNDADDAYAALTACYNWWCANDYGSLSLFYEDAYSDIGYNYTNAGYMQDVAKGSLSAASAPNKWKQYESIRRCNFVIENIDRVPSDKITEAQRNDILGQARAIRGYSHALVTNWYGDAIKMDFVPDTDEDAKVPRIPAAQIREFALEDLEWAADHINEKPAEKGRIAKGAVLAMLVRFNLYWGNWEAVVEYAERLKALNQYSLEPNFLNMFTIAGQNSREIIATYEQVATVYAYTNAIRHFNNADGGWASFVPTDNLVNMFEMANGLPIDDLASGYDPVHPYKDRDPRLKQTILYSGMDWEGKSGPRILNTLDETIGGVANKDYYNNSNNSSKTGLMFAKYAWPGPGQYSADLKNDSMCPIIFRYGEVLVSEAEAYAELNELDKALDILDEIRITRGHIAVDRTRYTTQAQVRELVRNERTIELAGEGFRYEDIVRWDEYDEAGNKTGRKVAQAVMGGDLLRSVGTVNMDPSVPEDERATINVNASRSERLIETRGEFDVPRRLLLPLLQAELDANPKLKQNPGY